MNAASPTRSSTAAVIGAAAALLATAALQTSLAAPAAARPVPGPPRHAQSTAARPATSTNPTFSFFDFPTTSFTSAYGMNLAVSTRAKQYVVGAYGPYVDANGYVLNTSAFLMSIKTESGVTTQAFQAVEPTLSTYVNAEGVNDAGAIVGSVGTTLQSGFVLEGGVFTQLDVPYAGATVTAANGINNSGTVAGGWTAADGVTQQGFTWKNGAFAQVPGYPGAIQTWPWAINTKGDLAGYVQDSAGVTHGFVLEKGVYTLLDYPGAAFTVAVALNDSGEVAGYYCNTTATCDDGSFGFLYSGGTYTSVAVPGVEFTVLNGINNKGTMSGAYTDSNGLEHSFLVTL
jgi:hypothetical protein